MLVRSELINVSAIKRSSGIKYTSIVYRITVLPYGGVAAPKLAMFIFTFQPTMHS